MKRSISPALDCYQPAMMKAQKCFNYIRVDRCSTIHDHLDISGMLHRNSLIWAFLIPFKLSQPGSMLVEQIDNDQSKCP
jgi:hypothetical protein